MIHLALIIGVGFLLFRVLWLIFGCFEAFLAKKSIPVSQTLEQGSYQNSLRTTAVRQQVNSKNNLSSQRSSIKAANLLEQKGSEKKTAKVEADSKYRNDNTSFEIKRESMRLEKEQKVSGRPQSKVQSRRESEIKAESPTQRQRNEWLEEKRAYEQRINKLMEQIDKYREEKVTYIQRIEEIIEHVSNEQELSEEIRSSSEDGQSRAFENLKHQLNVATQKMSEQKRQLIVEFQSTKNDLIRSYQQKLAECSKINSEKISQYSKVIDEITHRIYQLQEEKSLQYETQNKDQNQVLKQMAAERERLKQELQSAKKQAVQVSNQNGQRQALIKQLQQEIVEAKREQENLKSQLGKKQNDRLDGQIKLQSQIHSLVDRNKELSEQLNEVKKVKFSLEQELQSKALQDQKEKVATEDNNIVSDLIADLQKQLREEKFLREEENRKHSETIEELKFCQEQLKNARDTESQLRQKLAQGSKKTALKREDIEQHPEFISMKRRVQELQAKRTGQTEFKSSLLNAYSSPREIRQLSPTFANVPAESNIRAVSPHSESRGAYKSGFMAASTQPKASHLGVPPNVSTIMDRRYKTPSEKPVPQSSINEVILGNVYLGETNILDEAQRNLIIHQVSALKKITIRKTALLYSSSQKLNKPITEYLVGVPNLLVIVELANKSIIGAFTQNAFSKANQLSHSSIMSKAMIFSIHPQIFLVNESRGEAIHFEENVLTWGKQEIVINCKEPLQLIANLDCEGAVYPTAGITTSEFVGSADKSIPITKIEAYRNFFG